MAKKQKELPGIEKPTVKAVEAAADEYVEVRDRRMALTVKEVEARGQLITVMRQNKLTKYSYDGRLITLESLDKVKVKNLIDNEDD